MPHPAGHVAGCASYNFSSISFMQIVKAAEPVVSVLMLSVFYGCVPRCHILSPLSLGSAWMSARLARNGERPLPVIE